MADSFIETVLSGGPEGKPKVSRRVNNAGERRKRLNRQPQHSKPETHHD